MSRKKQRMVLIGVGMAVVFAAAALVMSALEDTLTFFYGPTELVEKGVAPSQRVRLGGLVEAGTVVREGEKVRFSVTDGTTSMTVVFSGVLPDLFREGQGVITEGRMRPDGQFTADTVLAKHDETYMPREVADVLKKNGEWRGPQSDKPASLQEKPAQ